MVLTIGIEPTTYRLQIDCSANWAKLASGGHYKYRTCDLFRVKEALSRWAKCPEVFPSAEIIVAFI